MRKLFALLWCSVALLLLVSACGNQDDDSTDKTDAAMKVGEEFIDELYNVEASDLDFDNISIESATDYQNEFKPYLTEKEFEELANKRLLLMPQEAAFNEDSNIAVQYIEFEQSNQEKEDKEANDAIDFEHSFTLLFTDQDGNEVEEVEIDGQMTVIYTDDEWKIDRYHDSKVPMEMLSH